MILQTCQKNLLAPVGSGSICFDTGPNKKLSEQIKHIQTATDSTGRFRHNASDTETHPELFAVKNLNNLKISVILWIFFLLLHQNVLHVGLKALYDHRRYFVG